MYVEVIYYFYKVQTFKVHIHLIYNMDIIIYNIHVVSKTLMFKEK